jgi:hypothetical protein
VDDHPRRLIDGNEFVVFVEYVDGDLLALGNTPRQLGKKHSHTLTGNEPVRRLGTSIIDAHSSIGDHTPQMGPAVKGKSGGQECIEPLISFIVSDSPFNWIRAKVVVDRHTKTPLLSDKNLPSTCCRLRFPSSTSRGTAEKDDGE